METFLDYDFLTTLLGLGVLCAPLLLLGFLGLCSLVDRPLPERIVSYAVAAAVFTGLGSSIGIVALMSWHGDSHLNIEFGRWIDIAPLHFHFSVKFLFDRLSLPFVIMAYV